MKVTIDRKGTLNIKSETGVEEYALIQWMKDNRCDIGLKANANLTFSLRNWPTMIVPLARFSLEV